MTLLTAAEDFLQNTLKALGGTLQRLGYVAGLRDHKGYYRHWGLERVHGRLGSEKALVQAHGELLQQALRTPLRELWVETQSSGADVKPMEPCTEKLLPEGATAVEAAHLDSVIAAMTALADEKRRRSTHQDA